MLIKQAQIAAMDRTAENKFLERIARFIGEAHEVEPGDALVIYHCKALVRSARSYNYRTELEIATFVSCGFAYGLNFDEDPGLPFAEILGDTELDVEFKAERMAQALDQGFDKDQGLYRRPEESDQA